MLRAKWVSCSFWLLLWGAATCSAAPPRVISAQPDDGDEDVDPKLAVLRVEFDQDMGTGGYSLCGVQEADAAGRPQWKNKRVIEMPITLQAGRNYTWSVNCNSARNFRSATGEPAVIYPLRFRTRGAEGKPALAPKLEEKRAAIARLRTLIAERYAYRDLRRPDWDQLFEQYSPTLEAATSWSKFARGIAMLLGAARDVHITVNRGEGESLATFRHQVQANFDPEVVKSIVPRWQSHNRAVATGKFDDGIGYLLIGSWSDEDHLEPAFAAIKEFADAPGLVIDVRPNAGGNELLARQVAGCFVRQPAVYSKHAIRDPDQPGGFTPQRERIVQPNDQQPPVTCQVAVLMGPANMSSCESFLLMMRAAPNVKLVGERSYGSSGNPQPHDIGGGIQVLLPSWCDYLPDGTLLEGRGVTPDVSVPAGIDDSGDAVLEIALARLRAK